MKTLYIDTHYIDVHIVLYEDNKILRRKDIINEKNNSVFVMPAIQEICNPDEIEEVIVINGPGSFTGVRIGVTIAKTIAYCLNCPIKVLSYFDILYISNDKNDGYYSLSDGNGWYIDLYSNNVSTKNYKYLNNSEYQDFESNNMVHSNIELDYEKIINYVKNIEPVNPHSVNPIYIKKIGVEQ